MIDQIRLSINNKKFRLDYDNKTIWLKKPDDVLRLVGVIIKKKK
jgi:hypothetical protein